MPEHKTKIRDDMELVRLGFKSSLPCHLPSPTDVQFQEFALRVLRDGVGRRVVHSLLKSLRVIQSGVFQS